jgi:hypothetical protein
MRAPILIGILVGVMCVTQAIAANGGGATGSAHSVGGGAHFSGGLIVGGAKSQTAAGKTVTMEMLAGKETKITGVLKLAKPLTDSDKKRLQEHGYVEYQERGSTYICSRSSRDPSRKVSECVRMQSPNGSPT